MKISPSPEALTTKQRVNNLHASLGIRAARPDFGGPLVSPKNDPDRARQQLIARYAVILGHAWGGAYADLEKVASDESIEPQNAVDRLLERYQVQISDTVRSCFAQGEQPHPAVQSAFGDMRSLVSFISKSSSGAAMMILEMVKHPVAFGVLETWRLHKAVPDVCDRDPHAGRKGDPTFWSEVADNSYSLNLAHSHLQVQVQKFVSDGMQLSPEEWHPDCLVLREGAGSEGRYGMETHPSVFEAAMRRAKEEGLDENLNTHVAIGCPAIHAHRPDSKKSVLRELHDLVGRVAKRHYARRFSGKP